MIHIFGNCVQNKESNLVSVQMIHIFGDHVQNKGSKLVCADDPHFWRSRPTQRIAPFNVYFAYHSTKISNLGSFGKALTIDI